MKANSNRILRALMSCGLLAMLAMQAQAQIATYQFTGTKTEGTAGIGNTIVGSLTLDVDAIPDYVDPGDSGGEYARWSNGNFSIDGMTDAGFAAGTSFGGDATLHDIDVPSDSLQGTYLESLQLGGTHIRGIQLFAYSYTAGDGIASVPNPWDPLSKEAHYVLIWDNDYETYTFESGSFHLDTFTLTPTTIVIDGCDTGIQDFVYEEQLVSEHLADFAATAKNHGAFVSRVAKLTNKLKKARLLTGKQKGVLVSCAAASSIGK